MPAMRMNSLKSLAMHWGPLSLRMRGVTPGYASRARWMMVSTSASSIFARISQCTISAAAAIEDGTEKVKGAGDVEVTDINMPVLMGPQGLDETGAFLGGRGGLPSQKPRGLEDAVDTGRATGDDIGVEHHEGEP